MKLRSQLQLYIKPASPETDLGSELRVISDILKQSAGISEIYDRVLQDINAGKIPQPGGRQGMSAEQAVRAGILRYRFGYSYRQLAHASFDSLSVREFLNLGFGKGFKKTTLQENIKKIQESTWKELNDCLKRYATDKGIENGEKVRTDTTVTAANIHYPTDASLLNDTIRVLTRAMTRARELTGAPVGFTNHYRASRKKLYKINNSRKKAKVHKEYLELIRLCKATVTYSQKALTILERFDAIESFDEHLQLTKAVAELQHYIPLGKRVIEQAYRRLVRGEKVPSQEKVVSIFEPHTDILVKGTRDIIFGHKVVLTTGVSRLILDAKVLEGNPADSSLVEQVINEHQEFFGHAPSHAAFDGCFASEANRDYAKGAGVEQLTFSKNRSLDLNSLVSSKRIHRALRHFRAGIEATVSILKRIFGWTRIYDKGQQSFSAAIQAGVVAHNLFILARAAMG